MKIRGNVVGTTQKPEKVVVRATGLTEEQKAQARANIGAAEKNRVLEGRTPTTKDSGDYIGQLCVCIFESTGNEPEAELYIYKGVYAYDDTSAPVHIWENVGSADVDVDIEGAVLYTEQTLTTEQQAQARENIGAIDESQLEVFGSIIETMPGGNLFNKNAERIPVADAPTPSEADAIIIGAQLDYTNGGAFYAHPYHFITPFIPVEYGKKYTTLYSTYYFGTTARMHLYDAEKKWLGVVYCIGLPTGLHNAVATFVLTSTICKQAAFCRLHHETECLDSYMVVEGDTYPSQYLQYGETTQGVSIDHDYVNSPLKGKIISFNGDSICAGAGASGGYGKIIAEKCGMIYENIGVSGGTVMYSGDSVHCISRTVANMREDAEYIILEGGVNDLYSDRALGAMSDGYDATLDDATFYGAFENMLKQALIRFPGKKIGYIAVHKMGNYFDSESTEDNAYHAAIKCCRKWGIPVCDLNISVPPFSKLSLNNDTKVICDTYTANGDGWHPNEAGYKAYYVPKIEAWLKTL